MDADVHARTGDLEGGLALSTTARFDMGQQGRQADAISCRSSRISGRVTIIEDALIPPGGSPWSDGHNWVLGAASAR